MTDTASGDAADPAAAAGDLAGSASRLAAALLRSVEVFVEVRADRLRLSLRRMLVRGAIGIALAVVTLVWLAAASLAVLRGLCDGLTVLWGGRVWLGNLTGGLLVLLLLAGTAALWLRLNARGTLARLVAKYERIRSTDDYRSDTSHSAQVDRGAARS